MSGVRKAWRRVVGVLPGFPNGVLDACRQLALFVVAELCYETVRGVAEGKRLEAFANATAIVDFQRATGTFFEPGLQSAALKSDLIVNAANFMYLNSHFVITTAFLIWLYFYRNPSFYFVRNMFMVAMALALVGYALFPTAPPRLLPQEGFVDTISTYANVSHDSAMVALFVNPFAAVPSMHVCFSLLVGLSAAALVSNPLGRFLWLCYPVLVFFTVIVTGNHFWIDAAAGAGVAATSFVVARYVLARARPGAWSWRAAAA